MFETEGLVTVLALELLLFGVGDLVSLQLLGLFKTLVTYFAFVGPVRRVAHQVGLKVLPTFTL